MQKKDKTHRHIEVFNPDVEIYNQERQDLLYLFNAGDKFKNFNEFVKREAQDFCYSGEGTTHLVWNVFYDSEGNEEHQDLVSYYTLAATSIPYIDRLRKEPEDMNSPDDLYDDKICGISAIEIKMFAVDEKYQDTFFEYEGEDLPVSAWIMRSIVNHVEEIIADTLGVKAIFCMQCRKQKLIILKINLIHY